MTTTIYVSPIFKAKDFEPQLEELTQEDAEYLDSAERSKEYARHN